MSQPIRLRLATPRDEEAAHRDRDLRRLLAVWRQLAVRYIAAEAHPRDGDELHKLLDAIVSIEDALRARHRRVWGGALQARLQRVLLELEHSAPGTPATDCVTCRRLAAHGLPVTVAELVAKAQR